MEIIIIGSGTGVPSLKRGSPALVVSINQKNLLFDSGPGAIRELLRTGITYQDIDYIFYTHLHTDHIADLGPLLFATKNSFSLRINDLQIIGPKGLKDFYKKLLNLYGDMILSDSYNIQLDEILERKVDYGCCKIVTKPLFHTEKSIGYRIETSNGKTVVYSGDTDYCENIIDLACDADLLILECSFPNEMKVEGHLTPSFAGKIAKESNCRKLLLTHLYPICEDYDIAGQCREEFSGEVILAEDLMKIEI